MDYRQTSGRGSRSSPRGRGPAAAVTVPRGGCRRDGPAGLSPPSQTPARNSPAGPYRPLTRREIAQAVNRLPVPARRATGQHEFLKRLGEDPELAQLRADRARNIAECARILARYASWVDRTTRPTRERICKLAGFALSTWKAARRWLEQHGYLGTVREGRTVLFMSAVLSALADGNAEEQPNEAAVYVLCVPRQKPGREPVVAGEEKTRPLTPSRSEGGTSPARPREDNRVAPLRKGPGSRLSEAHVASIARPFTAAGWTAADLEHAIGYPPAGNRHSFRLANVGSPAHWLAWRLSRWTTEPDVCWQAFRELGRWPHLPVPVPLRSPALRAEDHLVPVSERYLERNRAKAAAMRNALGPPAEAREIFDRIRGRQCQKGTIMTGILRKVFDASTQIPATAPDGADGVAGYIGGDAEHVWTKAEWDRFGHLRQFPIWVASTTGTLSAAAQAADAVRVARGLGWRPGRALVCEMDAELDATWWEAFAGIITGHGYLPVWYGSADARPAAASVWLADPDDEPVLPIDCDAKQYAWDVEVPGGLVDWSVMSQGLFDRGGEGPRA
jgi:hypothetical protein